MLERGAVRAREMPADQRRRVEQRHDADEQHHVGVDLARRPREGRRAHQRPNTRNAPVSVISATASPDARSSGPTNSKVGTRDSYLRCMKKSATSANLAADIASKSGTTIGASRRT